MRHDHKTFFPEATVRKLPWIRPSIKSVQLTTQELEEAGTTPESVRAFGLKLRGQGRL
jgi:hypothetical protein